MEISSIQDLPAGFSAEQRSQLKDLEQSKSETKLAIKIATKARKNLSKEDHRGKAELSTEIKLAKKKLNEIETAMSALLSVEHASSETEERADYVGDWSISEDTTGWDDFAHKHEASPFHRMQWREIFSDIMSRETKYFTLRDSTDNILAILPLCITRSAIFGSYAVSLPYVNYGSTVAIADNLENALIGHAFAQLENWQISHVELRDTKPRDDMNARTDKICMVLDLSEMENFRQLSGFLGSKVRAQVKKALSSGIAFQIGGTTLVKDFYSVFSRNMRDLGTPVYSKDLFAAILELFPNDSFVVVGYYNQQPISCAFLLNNNGAWEIPWASTIRSGNKIAANMALYARVLEEVLDRGAQQFDFGRSSKDASTYKFKKQWRAEPKQLYWYYSAPEFANSLTTDNTKYKMAIKAWQYLPLAFANTLGPHLVKNLP